MAENFLARFLRWLRAGYPDGVPQNDYVALLGLLHRQLTPVELDEIANELGKLAEESQEPITSADIARMVREQTYQQASDADIARVRAHLAAGGWPLASSEDLEADEERNTQHAQAAAANHAPVTPAPGSSAPQSPTPRGNEDPADDDREGWIRKTVNWLKAGYPKGIPDAEYVPLLALLHRRLSDEEVDEVIAMLRADGTIPADRADIGVAITKVTDEMPHHKDVTRVSDELGETAERHA